MVKHHQSHLQKGWRQWLRRWWLTVAYGLLALLAVFAAVQLIASQSASSAVRTGTISLLVSKRQYTIGDTVRFTLVNNSPNTVYISNNCPNEPLAVYRREGSVWQRVHDEAFDGDDKCRHEQRAFALLPHAQLSASYQYWPNLFNRVGDYRLVADIDGYAQQPSVDFTFVRQY